MSQCAASYSIKTDVTHCIIRTQYHTLVLHSNYDRVQSAFIHPLCLCHYVLKLTLGAEGNQSAASFIRSVIDSLRDQLMCGHNFLMAHVDNTQ